MAHVARRKRPGRRDDWLASYVGTDNKRHSKVFQKKVDADRFVVEMESRKLRGVWTNPDHGKELFGKWLKDWWATTTNLRPSSRARDESYMKKHVEPRFGDVPLAKISQLDVRAWVADLNKEGLKPATVRLIYQIVSRAMDAAVDGGMIPLSPCRNISLPRIERGEPRFLTQEEVHAIAAAVDPHYRTLILTAAYLGPRWGELAGLRPTRVDLLHRKLHIVEQLTEVRGQVTLDAPLKTASSRRTLTIPRFLVPLLEEQVGRNTEIVFASTEGTPLRRTNFRRRVWIPATEATDQQGVKFHDLRHTAVAFAIERGAHPRAIQERMGHASITTTLNVYGGLFPRLEEAIADGLDELYSAARA